MSIASGDVEERTGCARCGRPSTEHTVLPDRGHPTTGCSSFSWSFDPTSLPRMERQVANMKRLAAGESFDHCHCLDDADLIECRHCSHKFCPRHLEEHLSSLPDDVIDLLATEVVK